MKHYINGKPNASGAYSSPQSVPFSGGLAISAALCAQLVAHSGFVTLTVENGAVTAVTPDTVSWEAWKASLPAPAPPTPTPQEDADGIMVDHEYRLTLLELGVGEGVK